MKLHVNLVIVLVYAHAAVAVNRRPQRGFDSDKISFPEDISSPFVDRQGIVADHYKNAVKALFEVVIRLKNVLAHLEDGSAGGNFVMSPLSVAVALGQVLLGARGETRRRLAEVLTPVSGMRLDEQLHSELGALLRLLQEAPRGDDFALDVAAAFFVQEGLPVRDTYRYSLNRLYGTELLRLDFARDPVGAQKRVNAWVAQHTRGRIDNILQHPPPPTTAAVLTNCIYFNGRWEQPFDPHFTIQAPFHVNSNLSVPVSLMRSTFDTLYANSSTFSLVALPYLNETAAMYVVLPHDKQKDIGEFMSELSMRELHRVIESVTLQVVNMAMPRVSLSMMFNLREPLARLQKRKVQNEESMRQKRTENVGLSKGEEQNSSSDSLLSGRVSERVTKPSRATQVSVDRNGTDMLNISRRVGVSSDYRIASLVDTGDQYSTYINSASNFDNGKKPADSQPKWTRTQNKATTPKLGSTGPESSSRPTTTQSIPTAATKPWQSGSTQPPSDLMLDVTGASDDPRFRIDDIIHQSWLEITETGTEAAAAVVTAIDYSGDSVVFLVNRPFLFFIRHEVTLAPLFWGVIADPTSVSSRLSASKIPYEPSEKSSINFQP